ncbi:hypothetical protein STBA_39420 [Streptomyces sp. MP131-18]|nr:hypothetical protein STBA_39420 [Streptomyces sp. MP131-18]
MFRIAVDCYPGEPERSNALYRAHPLTWDELDLAAHCGTEPMTWTVKHDRDAFKEVWLEFANPRARFPLYPSQAAEITYSYSVSSEKWGPGPGPCACAPPEHNAALTARCCQRGAVSGR